MEFRPCIDIHNGKVKQIVGSSLRDKGDLAKENFVSEMDGEYYARFYKKDGIKGGHIILLNPKDSQFYAKTKEQALLALHAYPGGFQVGGGITAENASDFLREGASHVVVTSYVFSGGKVNYKNLKTLVSEVGKEHLVLDLSCRRRVDVEGKVSGIEKKLAKLLGNWGKIPVTYAGGIGTFKDLESLYEAGQGRLNVTVGSALDLFGGTMKYREVLEFIRERK